MPTVYQRSIALSLVALLLAVSTTLAGARSPAIDRVYRLPTSGALVQNTVTSQLQDSRGLMWFGTLGGLNVYDGYEFRLIPSDPRNPRSLAEVDIAALAEDAQGTIWVAGFRGWVDRLDPVSGDIRHYASRLRDALGEEQNVERPSRGPAAFLLAEDGSLYIGNALGLFRYWPAEDRLQAIDGFGAVADLAAGSKGSLWVGGNDGLGQWHPQHGLQQQFRYELHDPQSLSDNRITALLAEADGGLWIGTLRGLNYLPPGGHSFQRFLHDAKAGGSVGGDWITALLRDQQGRLWVAAQSGGLSLQVDQGFHVIHHEPDNPFSLSVDDIWSLYQDRSGLIWIGTAGGGLNQINPMRFRFDALRAVPHMPNSLRSPFVWDIVGDADGQIWLATLAGLERYQPQTHSFSLFEPVPGQRATNQLQALHLDADGLLWVGGVDGNLYRFDPANPRFERIHALGERDGRFSAGRVWYITAGLDPDELWISAGNEWISFDRRSLTPRSRAEQLGGESLFAAPIRVSLRDSDGIVWLGGGNALFRLDPADGSIRVIRQNRQQTDSLSENSVRALHQDAAGDLWIGTQNGLNRLRNADRQAQRFRFDLFSVADGLANNTVYGILGDRQGALWISTNAGLSRFQPEQSAWTNFDASDGLQANEMNGGAEWQGSDGTLYFGGIGGVVRFQPAAIQTHRHVPMVTFTDVGRLGERDERVHRPSAAGLELGPGDRGLSLGFAVADYHVPEKNRFRYRLLGDSAQWIETDRPRFELIRPSPGDYQLELLGAHRDGVWSAQPARLSIRVHPPWWATRSAYAGYALVCALIGLGYHRLQRRRLRREQEFSEQLARAQSLAEANYRLAERHAQIDALTQLPNRASLMEALERYLRISRANRSPLALLVINLDRFQRVNDTLGHEAGDQVLRVTASRLGAQVRGEDWLARVGSDEFALIAVGQNNDPANAWLDTLAGRLAEAIGSPHDLQDPPIRITASIGICRYRHEQEAADDLYTRADIAVHLAKQAGGNASRHYQPGQREQQQQRLVIENRLVGAVARKEMRAVFQPLIDLRSGALRGFESLIRWQPENAPAVFPDQFIPVAEESGLIIELGVWMLDEACRRWNSWAQPDWRVAVNISARHLQSGQLLAQVEQALQRHKVPARCLKLELTESAMMEYAEPALEQMGKLRAMGLTISIDDFGTGFSSLAHLQKLPVDELKIDRSFVVGLAAGEHNRKIVRSIIQLGHALKLSVVAEGIEDQVTLTFLRGLDCDIGQGYLFDRPQPADNLQRWLQGGPVEFIDVLAIGARQQQA